ncbi:hypothetical protein L596_012830 [Steinernema carpocapsae]|uniref:Nanos-type domain-containing protein n=1 Tax=Steinernema carpocapsae TaxID=34508 RepID=A0A4U5NY99_STECR|nr:hypothetical protein L596_012830 [Steinernema carpocapsae]
MYRHVVALLPFQVLQFKMVLTLEQFFNADLIYCVCSFCRARGYDPFGHTNKNCPEIARMRPCLKCGAKGFDNHTAKYCPKAKKKVSMKTNV